MASHLRGGGNCGISVSSQSIRRASLGRRSSFDVRQPEGTLFGSMFRRIEFPSRSLGLKQSLPPVQPDQPADPDLCFEVLLSPRSIRLRNSADDAIAGARWRRKTQVSSSRSSEIPMNSRVITKWPDPSAVGA